MPEQWPAGDKAMIVTLADIYNSKQHIFFFFSLAINAGIPQPQETLFSHESLLWLMHQYSCFCL